MAEDKRKEIFWQAADRDHQDRGPGWYGAIIGGGALLFILSMIQKNFFFGVFILFALGVLLAIGKTKPKVFDFALGDDGIKIDGRISYKFEKLESFSFRNRPGKLDEIILKKKATINPFLHIPIDSKFIAEARDILGKHLPEVDREESFMDLVSDFLGF